MKKYITLLLLFISFISSCSLVNTNKKNDSLINDIKTSQIISDDLRLDYIYPIPEVVLYGGGSFTYGSIEESHQNYIFLSNLSEDTAIISLKSNHYYLTWDSIRSVPRLNDSIIDAWKGDGFFVVLKLKVIDETGDEINCVGELEISSNNKSKKFKVHGGYTD